MRTKLAALAVVLWMSAVAEGALSKTAQEWKNGPERWLLTPEENKAWKSLQSDADAVAFIDLFWARRDPTPGTKRNEFHEEFLQRVRFADASFAEKRRRGALTERGQVFMLLGPSDDAQGGSMHVSGPSSMGAASGRHGERMEWRWSREKAVAVGVPKLEVAFVQQAGLDTYIRDVRFGQFANAHPAIVRSLIFSPDLTTVPEWAASISSAALKGAATTSGGAVAAGGGKATGKIGRVLLLRDLNALDLDAAVDPFTTLQPMTQFAVDGELAYLVEYCGNPDTLKVEMKVRDFATASELAPLPVKAVAGCGALPGMLSLAGVKPGTYDLEITTIEANGGRQSTKTRFEIR